MTDAILIPATAGELLEFTPPSLEKKDPKPVFFLRVPSAAERDRIGSTMFNLGLRNPTQEIIRATLIDELYSIYDEAKADELAADLETFWQTSKADRQAEDQWREQEIQRQLDIAGGAPERAPAAPPIPVTARRAKARMTILVDELMTNSPRTRKLQTDQLEYGMNQGYVLARMGVHSVQGLKLPDGMASTAPDPTDQPASVAWVNQLRGILADNTWEELTQRVDETYRLEEAERKNSGSPPESGSNQNGSAEQSDASESSAGSSTTSNTGPVPTDESASTTATS